MASEGMSDERLWQIKRWQGIIYLEAADETIRECLAEFDRLRAENERLREERDDYRQANESVRVCAKHTSEITNGTDCLVCNAKRLQAVVEAAKQLEENGYEVDDILAMRDALAKLEEDTE